MLIAAQAVLPALTDRASADGSDVLAFSDADALKALEAIIAHHPSIVALERLFAASARGVALISRIKADLALSPCEVRVVSQEIESEAVMPTPAWLTAPTLTAADGAEDADVDGDSVHQIERLTAPEERLDPQGTRWAPRLVLSGVVEVTLDGNAATLVDLSTLGAQVVSPTVLKPNQRIRVVIADQRMNIRLTGTIAWASFEIVAGSGPRYRAGIEFVNPDAVALDALCRPHHG